MILKNVAVVLVASTLFLGCGGGGGGTSSNTQTPPDTSDVLTGVFADEPVYGLKYKTATQEGYTDANGAFKYKAGEDVEFFLNTLSLGKVKADEFITPYILSGDIFDNGVMNIDVPSEKTKNIALLLQNFDANRTDTKNIDVTRFQNLGEYDISFIDLNSSTSEVEGEISALLSTGGFQQYIDETNNSLIDTATATARMQNYINKVRMFEGSYRVYGITDYVDDYQFTQNPEFLGWSNEAGLKNFDVSGYNGFYIEINDPDYKIDLLNLDGQNIYTTSSYAINTSNVNMAMDEAHFLEEFATANDGKYATLSSERASIMLSTHGKKTLSIKMIKILDTVYDERTALRWQDSVDNLSSIDNSKSWANAKAYCEDLVYSGKSDWQLPTLGQLRTTIDMTQSSRVKADFQNIADFGDDTYWVSDNSSSPYMAFSYGSGRNDYDPQTMHTLMSDGSGAYVRCVRTTNQSPVAQDLTLDLGLVDAPISHDLNNEISDEENGDSDLNIIVVTPPTYGTLTWSNNTFTYTITDGTAYAGNDSFTYYVMDPNFSQSQTRTVTLLNVSDY